MGFDLNRHWQEPSPWAHPTLYATKNLLIEMDSNEVMIIMMIVDGYISSIRGRESEGPRCLLSQEQHLPVLITLQMAHKMAIGTPLLYRMHFQDRAS